MNFYYNCPIRWVPNNLWKFIKIFDTIKLFPAIQMPQFENISSKFINASTYFDAKLNKYHIDALKEK